MIHCVALSSVSLLGKHFLASVKNYNPLKKKCIMNKKFLLLTEIWIKILNIEECWLHK